MLTTKLARRAVKKLLLAGLVSLGVLTLLALAGGSSAGAFGGGKHTADRRDAGDLPEAALPASLMPTDDCFE